MKTATASIDDYLEPLPPDQRAALEVLRRTIKATIPTAEECISYGIPTFRFNGKSVVHMGASNKHCSLYPGSYPIEVFEHELASYSTSKGTIRFTPTNPIPVTLVKKIVKCALDRSRRTNQ